MKHKSCLILFSCLCLIFSINAQDVPQAISYQGVALDVNGLAVNNNQIGVKFTISSDDGTEIIIYSESHLVLTSSLGHFSAEIGRGEIIDGIFTDISWVDGPYFLNVALDLLGTLDYKNAGTVLIQSVPYALVAKNSANKPLGLEGEIGPDGLPGAIGLPGPIGATGPSGQIGTICFPWDGSIGPPGEPGPPGLQGATGPQGLPGPNGAKGPTGPIGLLGLPGFVGEEGIPGPQGIKGPKGPNGPEGEVASDGIIGPEGEEGPQGLGGGPQGPAGPAGQPGPPGLDALPAATGGPGPQGHSRFVMTNQAPNPNNFTNIYLDDGTNRADGKPGFKLWNGSDWIDIKTSN